MLSELMNTFGWMDTTRAIKPTASVLIDLMNMLTSRDLPEESRERCGRQDTEKESKGGKGQWFVNICSLVFYLEIKTQLTTAVVKQTVLLHAHNVHFVFLLQNSKIKETKLIHNKTTKRQWIFTVMDWQNYVTCCHYTPTEHR